MAPAAAVPSVVSAVRRLREDPAAEEVLGALRAHEIDVIVGEDELAYVRLKAVQDALVESRERMKFALEAAEAGLWDLDLETEEVFWNEVLYRLLGRDPDSAPMGLKTFFSYIHPDDRARVRAHLDRLLASDDVAFSEAFRVVREEGEVRWFAGDARLVRDENGVPTHLIGLNTDITARKRTEERLQAQLEELRAIYDSAPVGLCVFDGEGRYIRINERLAEINGRTLEQHIGKRMREVVPSLAPKAERLIERVVRTGEPVTDVEFEGDTAAEPGERHYWVEQWFPLKDPTGAVVGVNVVVEDVTARRRADAALKREREVIEGILENTDAMLAYLDEEFNFVHVNEAYARNSGFTKDELSGKNHFDLFPDRENERLFERVRATGEPVSLYDRPFEYAHEPGRGMSWWNWTLAPVLDGGGSVRGFVLSLMETTQRVEVERALRESERRFRLVLDNSPISVFTQDRDLRYTWVYNPQGDYPPVAMLGKRDDELYDPSRVEELVALKREVLETGRSVSGRVFSDLDLDLDDSGGGGDGDGRPRAFDVAFEPIFGDGGDGDGDGNGNGDSVEDGVSGLTGVELDVTERERALERANLQLAQREKLALIGALAGGIAHDLRNPLAAIGNAAYYLRLALDDIDATKEVKDSIAVIEDEVARADRIITSLLSIPRGDRTIREAVDLRDVVQRVLTRVELPQDTTVRTVTEGGAPMMEGDPEQLAIIFTNLVRNAVEAMAETDEPRLTIAFELDHPEEGELTVRVEDAGCGIAGGHLERLFEPLFTLREEGVGLGLTLVKTLVETHGGKISVASEEGGCTVFTLVFPVSGEDAEDEGEGEDEGGAVSLRAREPAAAKTMADSLDLLSILRDNDAWKRLQEELRTHKIELEMQNEELQRTQRQLQNALERYADLYEYAPAGHFTLDEHGVVLGLNLTGAKMLGKNRAQCIRHPLAFYIASEERSLFYRHIKRVWEEGGEQFLEVTVEPKAGEPFAARLESRRVTDHDGETHIRMVLMRFGGASGDIRK